MYTCGMFRISDDGGLAVYMQIQLSLYLCSHMLSTVRSRIKVAAVSDCIITGANLTAVEPQVIREDIVLTLSYVALS